MTDHTLDAWIDQMVSDQRAEDRVLDLEHKLNTLSKNVSVLIQRLEALEGSVFTGPFEITDEDRETLRAALRQLQQEEYDELHR